MRSLKILASAVSFAALAATPALAHNHGDKPRDSEATMDAMSPSVDLTAILAADIRDDDRARDQYRNPGETLAFFGLKPDMKIGEYGPGGGWYTRILALMLAESGTYVAVGADVEKYFAGADEERIARAKAFPETFPGRAAEFTGLSEDLFTAVEIDEVPEAHAGTFDAVVMFRSLHGLWSREMADGTVADMYGMLKPGGVVGVVQHRAKEDAPYAYVQGRNGYLKQSQVISLFKSQGFELVKTSEINANPNDTADHEGGVWTLPPRLRYGDENREEYLAIGESDRMTLLFRKPE